MKNKHHLRIRASYGGLYIVSVYWHKSISERPKPMNLQEMNKMLVKYSLG